MTKLDKIGFIALVILCIYVYIKYLELIGFIK